MTTKEQVITQGADTMTEQEQKAFTAMLEALENHPGNHVLTKAECAAIEQALTAAKAVQPQAQEPKLPEYFAQYEYAPDFSVVVSVYRRRADDVPELIHSEALPKQIDAHPQATEPADPRFAGIDYEDLNAEIRSMRDQIGRLQEHINKTQQIHANAEGYAVQPQATEPAGWRLVPLIPTEEQWGGLARDIMMWLDMDGRKTAGSLFKHLERCGTYIPQWLRDEPEMKNLDHVPSKGTRAAIIYRAMLAAAPESHHGK